ncbi:hypothetical protein Tco_0480571 [Tanacetum coccineum]
MSDAFDELEAALDQSFVDRKHDEIERKNLLIEHDNIIADGLSKEVFYVASNSELNVSRYTEMQKAHNVVKARCLALEVELSNLRDNIHKDNYNELLNRFSNLEFGLMKTSLQGKDNVIQKLKMEISQLKETRVNCRTDASGSQPRSILKKHRILPAKSDSLKKVEDHLRIIRSSLKTQIVLILVLALSDPIPNVAQDPVIPTSPSVSIAIDLDAPSGSHTSSPLNHHSFSVHHGVAGEQYAEVNPFAVADPEPFVNVFATDYNSEASSSGEITIPEPNQSTLPHEHIRKWTDSHPLDNIIGNPSRPVSGTDI